MKPVEGAACPLCGQPVQENAKAFGCSAWKSGCRFTLWKDGLARGGGPQLNEKIIRLLLKDGQVAGSTGVLALKDGFLTFTKKGEQEPSARMAIAYEKKG